VGSDISFPPVQRPYPPLWFGGSSDAGIAVAGKHADVYLSWGEPPALLAEKIARARVALRSMGGRCGLDCVSTCSFAKRRRKLGLRPIG
jgi:alkanesulfonate monooxygenase SsuD/methylene tetrahydromethanopterin reductase-like flavin-dependent oxidoreductase (luciferase family)